MKFTGPEAEAFNKVYDAFEERKAIGRVKIRLIDEYAAAYDKMTDARADEPAHATLGNYLAPDNLYKKYYDQFSMAVGGANAARYMQMEGYLETAVRREIQDALPFAGI